MCRKAAKSFHSSSATCTCSFATMTSPGPGGTCSTSSSLVTAVADALEDLGLKRLVVGSGDHGGQTTDGDAEQHREGEKEPDAERAYHQAVGRAYRADRGGMSLTVARKLLGMARALPPPGKDQLRSILRGDGAVVGRAGITTWDDLEAVCRELGCPTCYESGEEEIMDENDDDADESDDKDAATQRKLELTLFLATEVECRRILCRKGGDTEPASTSPPTTSTSTPSSSATPNANVLQKLIEASPPGQDLSDHQLRSILAQSTDVTSDQVDQILQCNRALRADYSLRTKLMRQKFDATAIAMARSRRHRKGGGIDQTKKGEDGSAQEEGVGEEDPLDMEIREIASGMTNMNLSAADSTNAVDDSSGDDILHQFLLPPTRFAPASQTQVMRSNIATPYDRGGRVDRDDRNSMPAWQTARQPGPPPRKPPRTPGGVKSPGHKSKKKTPRKTPKKDPEIEKETAGADAYVTMADAKDESGRTQEARTPNKDQDGGKKRNSKKRNNRGRGNRGKPGQKPSETSEGKS